MGFIRGSSSLLVCFMHLASRCERLPGFCGDVGTWLRSQDAPGGLEYFVQIKYRQGSLPSPFQGDRVPQRARRRHPGDERVRDALKTKLILSFIDSCALEPLGTTGFGVRYTK
jgi:hypothetical protein